MEKKVQILFDDIKEFIGLCEYIGVIWSITGYEGNEFEFTIFANTINLFTLFHRCGLRSMSIYQL